MVVQGQSTCTTSQALIQHTIYNYAFFLKNGFASSLKVLTGFAGSSFVKILSGVFIVSWDPC